MKRSVLGWAVLISLSLAGCFQENVELKKVEGVFVGTKGSDTGPMSARIVLKNNRAVMIIIGPIRRLERRLSLEYRPDRVLIDGLSFYIKDSGQTLECFQCATTGMPLYWRKES